MNPFQLFFVLLIIVPVVEIYFLIQVGSVIGGFETVLLVIFTAILGAYLFRVQGLTTVQRLQATLARGEIPAIEMVEGIMLLICGVLLLTPGFFTDAIGFLCLLPALRQKVALAILSSQFIKQAGGFSNTSAPYNDQYSDSDDIDIIEGEFKRDEKDEKENKRLDE